MLSNLKISVAKKRMATFTRKALSEENKKPLKFGVILDSEDDGLKEHFLSLKETYGLRDADFQIVTCKDERIQGDIFQGLVFTRKDLKWNGKIRNGEITNFAQQRMDVLISFTESDNKLAALLVSVANAELKVGRKEEASSAGLFDMLINTEFEEVEIFLLELKKYLKILNKL